jgi:ribosome-associated protein
VATRKPAPARKKTTAAKPAKKKTIPKKAPPGKPVKVKAKPKAAKPKVAARKAAARGVPEQLRDAALKILDERQAEAIVTADLRGKSAMADYAIAAAGKSGRQLAAIAHYLREGFEKAGVKRVRVEGLPQGDWVLIDAGDVIVHLFRPEVRRYYNIEDIWNRSPREG